MAVWGFWYYGQNYQRSRSARVLRDDCWTSFLQWAWWRWSYEASGCFVHKSSGTNILRTLPRLSFQNRYKYQTRRRSNKIHSLYRKLKPQKQPRRVRERLSFFVDLHKPLRNKKIVITLLIIILQTQSRNKNKLWRTGKQKYVDLHGRKLKMEKHQHKLNTSRQFYDLERYYWVYSRGWLKIFCIVFVDHEIFLWSQFYYIICLVVRVSGCFIGSGYLSWIKSKHSSQFSLFSSINSANIVAASPNAHPPQIPSSPT